MKVGDLVTLSARGANLEACWRWTKIHRGGPNNNKAVKLVGLILAIETPNSSWDHQQKYTVSWISDGPAHREPYNYGRGTGYWHRSDLKFVAKAK